MASYRLTSQGQATIPKVVRDELGLRPGDAVAYTREGERWFISRAEYERPEDHPLIQRLRGARPHMTMSSQELMALLRDPEDIL